MVRERWAEFVQDHCSELKKENSWLPVLSGHALCFPRRHISAVALYLAVRLIHTLQAPNAGENRWQSRSSSVYSDCHELRGRVNAQGSLV